MTARNPTWVAQNYRLYNDTGVPGSSALAAQNTAGNVERTKKVRLRFNCGDTNNATQNNIGSWVLQYRINGGSWVTVTTSSNVRAATSGDSANFSDGTALSQVLSTIAGTTYQTTWDVADTNAALPSQTWADTYTEYEVCLELNTVSVGDAITFQLLSPSTSTATTFTNVPTINVIGITWSGSGAATLAAATASGTGKSNPNPVFRIPLVTAIFAKAMEYGQQVYQSLLTTTLVSGPDTHSGSGAATTSPVTASGTGKRSLLGSGAATVGAVTASGTGKKARSGSGAADIAPVTASGTGKKARSGSGAADIAALTASGTGTKGKSGTGAATIAAVTASGTGTKERKGSGAATISPVTASGTAKRGLEGSGAATLAPFTASGTAKRVLRGSGAATVTQLFAEGTGSTGTVQIGSGAATLSPLTASGTAKRTLKGSGSATITALTASGTAKRALKGSGAATLTALSASGTAQRALKAAGAATLAVLTASGAGYIGEATADTNLRGPLIIDIYPRPYLQVEPPPNLLLDTLAERLVAFCDQERPDGFRYFPQPEYVRNSLAYERLSTKLFQIQNVEWPVIQRTPFHNVPQHTNTLLSGLLPPMGKVALDVPAGYRYYQPVDVFPSLALRHGVTTTLYPIIQTDWPITHKAYWQQEIDPPNRVILEGLATQLFIISQQDWPEPRGYRYYHQTDFSIALNVAELKPPPLADSQKGTWETPSGFRYFAQPDAVQNITIQGIPPAPELRFPFNQFEWPTPRPAVVESSLYDIPRGTRIVTAAPPVPPIPTIALSANPLTIYVGEAATLTWDTEYATTVTASGGWSGNQSLDGSASTGPLYSTTIFGLTADGPGGSDYASVVVQVRAVPVPPVEPLPPSSGTTARPGGRTVISVREVGEITWAKFDFISRLKKGDTIASQSVTASVYSGTDPNPTQVIVGNAYASGTVVSQKVRGGVLGVIYGLVCRVVTTSGSTIQMSAYFSIIPYKGS
jgi:hypothetical protein